MLLWVLWEARNQAKHNNIRITFEGMRSRSMQILSATAMVNMTRREHWKGMETLATSLGVFVQRKQLQPAQILPGRNRAADKLTVNIDAAYKQGTAGYGGIIRNDKGELIWAVGLPGKADTALEAEIIAVRSIMKWCIDRGFRSMRVETDSLLLTKHMQSATTKWTYTQHIKKIKEYCTDSLSDISHILREQNQAADLMAGEAIKSELEIKWGFEDIPTKLKAILQLERDGIPYLRRSKN